MTSHAIHEYCTCIISYVSKPNYRHGEHKTLLQAGILFSCSVMDKHVIMQVPTKMKSSFYWNSFVLKENIHH